MRRTGQALGWLSLLLVGCGSCGSGSGADPGPGPDGPGLPGGARENPCDAERDGPFFHVSTSGTDNPECSEAAPCRTIQHAAEVVDQAGSVVRVAAGTYDGFHSVHPNITFEAVGEVVVNTSHAWSGGPTGDNINVENTDGVVIDGFRVRDATRTGIRVATSSDVILCNNVSGPNERWGILTGFAPRVLIIGNETFDSEVEHGIYVSNSDAPDDAPIIYGNRVYGNGTNGIQLNGDCLSGGDGKIENAVVEGNEVYDNDAKGLSIIGAPGITIVNNLIHDNGNTGAAGGIHMTNEPGCDEGDASSYGVVVNNTVVEPRIAAFRATDGATGNVVFNNIFASPKGAEDEVGSNHLGVNRMADDGAGLFVEGGYELAPDSPARDAGAASFMDEEAPSHDVLGTARPQGAGLDQGAFEAR